MEIVPETETIFFSDQCSVRFDMSINVLRMAAIPMPPIHMNAIVCFSIVIESLHH